MITVNIYGLDQFVVGDLSVTLGKNLAKIYEVSEDEINFISTNNMVFHAGSEQTSWRVIVEVNLPKKLEVLQDQALEIINHYISEVAINIETTFRYYLSDHHSLHLNEDYPLYLEAKDEIEVESDYSSEELEEGEGEDEIYTGDIFEGIN